MNFTIIPQTNVKAISYAVIMVALTFICGCKSDSSQQDQFLQDHHSPQFKWGFIDNKGELAIQNEYDDVRDFSYGLAAVNYQGKWGYIDKGGTTQLDFAYKEAKPYDGKFMIVRNYDNSWSLIDKQRKVHMQIQADRFSKAGKDIYKFQHNGLYGFLNYDKDTLSRPLFSKAQDFIDGYALCKIQTTNILLTLSGEQIVLPYKKVFPSSGNFYRFLNNGTYGFLDKSGNVAITNSYDYASDFIDGRSYVESDGKSKIIDNQGAIALELEDGAYTFHSPGHYVKLLPDGQILYSFRGEQINTEPYDMLYAPKEGQTAVMKDDKWGFINEEGKLISPIKYPLVWSFSEGLARYIEPEMGIGFMNKTGYPVIKPYFFEVKDFKEGLARVQVYR